MGRFYPGLIRDVMSALASVFLWLGADLVPCTIDGGRVRDEVTGAHMFLTLPREAGHHFKSDSIDTWPLLGSERLGWQMSSKGADKTIPRAGLRA